MKICKACNRTEDTGAFCKKCGKPLEEIEDVNETVDKGETEPHQVADEIMDEAENTASESESPKQDAENNLEDRVEIIEEADIIKETSRTDALAEEEDLSPKEAKKLEKERAKEEKIREKEAKKQAAIDLKLQKEQTKEAEKKAKEEKKKLKAEKKANRKFKKTRRFFKILLLLIVLLLIFLGWYLGHSQIAYKYEKGDGNLGLVVKAISEDKDLDGAVTIPYPDFNDILNNNVDFSEVDAINMTTVEDAYYSQDDSKFVLTLKSFLGKTSLLTDPKLDLKDGKVSLELKDAKLGKWHFPLFNNIAKTPIKKEIEVPDFVWIKIIDLDYEDEGLDLRYDFDTEKLNEDVKSITKNLDSALLTYLEESKVTLPGVDLIVKKDKEERFKDEDLQKLLKAFVKEPEDIINWTLVAPKEMEKDFVSLSEIIYGEKETKKALKKLKEGNKDLDKNFDEFLSEELEKALKDGSKKAFEKIKAIHTEFGVPPYYFGDKGRIYSQTMQTFIDNSMLDLAKNKELEDLEFSIYGYGNKAIYGAIVDDEIWFIEEGNDKIQKENKKVFYNKIKYEENPEDAGVIVPNLDINEIKPLAEAIIKEEGFGEEDKLAIRYLAHTKEYGLAIAALQNKTELGPKYYLLDNKESEWRVIDSFDENQRLGEELVEEIQSGQITPQLLPKYEMADFTRGFLNTADRKMIQSKLPDGYKISTYVKEDDNIYVVAKDANKAVVKYLFPQGVEGDGIAILATDSPSSYINDLSPKEEFSEYRPDFVFDQIPESFSGN